MRYILYAIIWTSQQALATHLYLHHQLTYHFCMWMLHQPPCEMCNGGTR